MSTCLTCHKKATVQCKRCLSSFCKLDWELNHEEISCNVLIAGKDDDLPVVLVISAPGDYPDDATIATNILKEEIQGYNYITMKQPTVEEARRKQPAVIFVIHRMAAAVRAKVPEEKANYMKSFFSICNNVMFLYLENSSGGISKSEIYLSILDNDGGFSPNVRGGIKFAPRLIYNSATRKLSTNAGEPLEQNKRNLRSLKFDMDTFAKKNQEPRRRKPDAIISLVAYPGDSDFDTSSVETALEQMIRTSYMNYELNVVKGKKLTSEQRLQQITEQAPDVILVPYLIKNDKDRIAPERAKYLKQLFNYAPHVMFLYMQDIGEETDPPVFLADRPEDGGFNVNSGKPVRVAPRLWWRLMTLPTTKDGRVFIQNIDNMSQLQSLIDTHVINARQRVQPSATQPVPAPAQVEPVPLDEVAALKAEIAQMKEEFKGKKAKYLRIYTRVENEKKALEEKLRQATRTSANSQDLERLKQNNARLQGKLEAIQKLLSQ